MSVLHHYFQWRTVHVKTLVSDCCCNDGVNLTVFESTVRGVLIEGEIESVGFGFWIESIIADHVESKLQIIISHQ